MRNELAMLLVAAERTKLRQILRDTFASLPASSVPSVSEILSTSIPYLDGVLEEVLRFANAAPLLVRSATVDTTILGYNVPKGSHIMCNAQFMEEPQQPGGMGEAPGRRFLHAEYF
ncbi:hypothetical protein DL769_006497 [Monosporascus sp. CRB-8-3]|nr:hypothetical protein DL769_006497 [Monosporascus sp. CRB-8-3]